MGAFKTELRNDEAFLNGIARFDIEVNGNQEVVWTQST